MAGWPSVMAMRSRASARSSCRLRGGWDGHGRSSEPRNPDMADVAAGSGGVGGLHHRLLGAPCFDDRVLAESVGELLDGGESCPPTRTCGSPPAPSRPAPSSPAVPLPRAGGAGNARKAAAGRSRRRTRFTPSTATRMCDRLVRKGLVDRSHRQSDRREVELRLSAAGGSLVNEVTGRRRRDCRRVSAWVSEHDQAQLLESLQIVNTAAGEQQDSAWSLGLAP